MVGRSSRWVRLIVAAGLAASVAGCSGEGILNIIQPGEPVVGTPISGQVQAPDGELTRVPLLWDRVLALAVQPLRALTVDNLQGVGAGVEVRLILVQADDIVEGLIPTTLPVVATATTNASSQYQLVLPLDTGVDTCRFMVEVGSASNGTLTRAFVFREGDLDINFQSETVVRLILNAIATGLAGSLCDFEPAEIGALYDGVVALPGELTGTTVASVNAEAYSVASANADIQELVRLTSGEGFEPGPTFTPTPTIDTAPAPTVTATRTVTVPLPTRTSTTTVATATETRAARTSTPVATNTVPPVPTATSVPPATNTIPLPTSTLPPVPTATVPIVPLPTSTATTQVPISTSTPIATNTTAPTATEMTEPPPEVNLGTVAGAPGTIVSVPAFLVGTAIVAVEEEGLEVLVGTAVVAVSNDIEFDTRLVDIVLSDGQPDCEAAAIIAGRKTVIASVPEIAELPADRKVVRVGVIGLDNNDPLPQGLLYSCRFAIDEDTPSGSITLENMPEATDGRGNAVVVIGSDGVITATAAP